MTQTMRATKTRTERVRWTLCLAGVLIGICCSGCEREDRPNSITPVTTAPPAKPQASGSKGGVKLQPGNDCEALTELAQGSGVLKLCGGASRGPAQVCPTADEIVVLVDNDDETAARRMGRDVPATNWQDILVELDAIGRTECDAGSRPLERLPGNCGTIQGAVGGWNLGSCRNASGRLFPRFINKGSGGTTPATEVVQRIEGQMTRQGSGAGLVFMAFDGVVDGDYRNAAARLAFAEAVTHAISSGLKVWIVASPVDYRYIYLFARPQFEAFADKVARALAGSMAARSALVVVTVSLSEGQFRNPAARAGIAHVQIARPPLLGARWDYNGLTLRRRQDSSSTTGVMWKLDMRRWLSVDSGGGDTHGALMRLSWNADQSQWDSLAPFGVRLSAPAVLLNRPVSDAPNVGGASPNGAWVRDPRVEVGALECPARVSGPLSGPFAQAASIVQGQADFLLIRGVPANTGWLSGGIPGWASDAKSLRSGLASSSGASLMAAVLVSPRPTASHCTESLLGEFAGSHKWGSAHATPDLANLQNQADCDSPQWKTLIQALSRVQYRRFRPGAASPWSPTDARVAAETFLTVIETTARRIVNALPDGADSSSCALASFQVEIDRSGADSPVARQWKQEPIR